MASVTTELPRPREEDNIIQKLWTYRKYFTIEPLIFFFLVPIVFNADADASFPLEKACRVNSNYSHIVCETILDKEVFGIDCDAFNFENNTIIGSGLLWNVTHLSPEFNYTVCKAERDAQKLTTRVSGIRAPIAAIFPLIVVLFAGGWSDRYNKRKPCLLFPVVGQAIAYLCLFISAIFFDTIPMEFGAYIQAIIPSMFGGWIFLFSVASSYITAATPEPDRVFRYGIFAMFLTFIFTVGLPVSGFLLHALGYVYSFAISWISQVVCFLYVIFFIEEVQTTKEKEALEGTTNLGFKFDETNTKVNALEPVITTLDEAVSTEVAEKKKKSCLAEFFDPTLALSCITLLLAKRPGHGQALLVLLIIAFFLMLGPVEAEDEYWFKFQLIRLNWNGIQKGFYETFSTAMSFIGTFIGTAIMSKWLGMSDSMIGLISGTCIVISRPIFAFSRTTAMFYAAGIPEMFISLRGIATKAITSNIVEEEEVNRLFAIYGACQPIGQFIFPSLYAVVYERVLDTFPGAIFLFSDLFFIPNAVAFLLCYFLLRMKPKQVPASKSNDVEITHL